MLLAEVFFEARELKHDEEMEGEGEVEKTHRDKAIQAQGVAHKAYEENEYETAEEGVKEAKVDCDPPGDEL